MEYIVDGPAPLSSLQNVCIESLSPYDDSVIDLVEDHPTRLELPCIPNDVPIGSKDVIFNDIYDSALLQPKIVPSQKLADAIISSLVPYEAGSMSVESYTDILCMIVM